MAFYLRKSLRMGPVRVNLSKSGLGVSAGVKGARVGLNSKGRSYVHAGRHGVYVRKQFGSSSRSSTSQPRSGRSEPIVLYEDTGVAYQPAVDLPNRTALKLPGASRLPAKWGLWGTLAGALLIAMAIAQTWNVIGGLLIVGGVGFGVWAYRRNRSADTLRSRLESLVSADEWSDERWEDLEQIANEGSIPEATARAEYKRAYLLACRSVVEDGVVDDSEITLLNHLEKLLNEDRDFVQAAKTDAFRGLYFTAVADHDLDPGEEGALEHVRERLEVPEQDIEDELRFMDRLKELRSVRAGQLEEVEPSFPIQKSEVCYYEAPGRFLKEKQLKTYQQDGQRYKVRGLVVDKDGTLLITNKRVLLVHSGTSAVRHNRILDLELDLDENVIRITKDGAKTPTVLATPDAVRAAAVIAVFSELRG